MQAIKKLYQVGLAVALAMALATLPAVGQTPGTLNVTAGKVGIGTDDPRAPLHVLKGGAPFTLLPATVMAFQNNANPTDGLLFSLIGGSQGLSNAQITFGNSTNQTIGRFIYHFGEKAMLFYLSGAEKARLTDTGRLGIGTLNPAGALDVNGTIYQRGGVVHPDYVFEPDYELLTIEEQADFMWTNKHLPSVGAGHYDDEGRSVIEVGANSAAMLEELEKAHIYIDQLHNRLKELEATVASLTIDK